MEHLELELPLYRFYLATCRNIWVLLPQEESRKGIELAEQFVAGEATWEQVSRYNWHTEGAAFSFENDNDPEIPRLVREADALDKTTLREILSKPEVLADEGMKELLKSAAYFADHSMIYPSIQPKGPPREHTEFMFADTLRKYVEYPSAHKHSYPSF